MYILSDILKQKRRLFTTTTIMNHQDFEPVIWRKSNNKNRRKKHTDSTMKTNNKLDSDDGIYTIKKSSIPFQLSLRKAREAKQLSQKELALKLNISVSVLRSYEIGTVVPSNNVRSSLNHILSTKLPKP